MVIKIKNNHIKAICAHFDLGTLIHSPTRVHGGLLHTMWRIDTNKASYAIKQLSKDIVLTDERIIKNYELSERIASHFVRLAIPAVNANEAYQNAMSVLKTHVVVSHGDLDQKNVLWDSNNNPILIDWESACKINPTYDIINTAFYWSGITSHFNKEIFFKMINAYQNSGGVINTNHLEAACYAAFSWIGWLLYNIERSCVSDESEQKTLGIEQVNQTLATILRLQMVIPVLIKIIAVKMKW